MEGTEKARELGTSLFPRVMKAVRREGQLPSAEQKANQNVTGSMDPSLGISVSLQTETSWLNEHNLNKRNSVCSEARTPQSASPTGEKLPDLIYKEEDLYSSLSEDLSDLSVLCDMEFSFEYKTCFEKHLNMLPSVGPPTILAYKRESSENDRILAMMKILKERSGEELCKFCRNPLKPFPVESTLYQDFSQEVFCCRQFRDMIQYLLKQQNYVLQNKEIERISVSPHGPYGSEIERQKAKEKTALRLRERHMAKVFESVVTEPTTFLEFGKPMKTISYQLSNAPPVGDNWTIVPEEADSMTSTDSAENELSLCDFTSEMIIPERFVEKYYRTGSKFLTMFPDGTAQIFYPSGNIAIIVIPSNVKEAICIVQEDKDHNAEILAIFGSSGKSTCYHPNGMVWININPVGGQYLDSAGRRVRRWNWKSSDSRQPCAQFKPIFISLNLRVGVRIIAQDKIYVSFLAMGKQAKFSVGRKKLKKSQVEDIEMDKQSITTSHSTAEDELILFAIKIKFLSVLNKCYECLHSPSKKQWDKVKPPSFLVAQAQKLIYLCSACDISTDVSASVQDTLRNYVTCDLLT
ncbi:glutamate-rich protein 6 isoform X1 [Rana temporaria]|uniref:glutamate-rich protein 6 isoform X1 n=1 Tax=Rana temporaria TaxID=8407 RepID=UPI001AAD002D|nr:glutamate-rich protein 6 isoform X1 [Rana temporaria]